MTGGMKGGRRPRDGEKSCGFAGMGTHPKYMTRMYNIQNFECTNVQIKHPPTQPRGGETASAKKK